VRGLATKAEAPAPAAEVTEVAQLPAPAPPTTGTASIDDFPPIPPAEPEAPIASAIPPAPAPAPAPLPSAKTEVAAVSTPPPAAPSSSAASSHPPSDRADLVELANARGVALERPNDRHALKAWATAASHAGAMREARRAGEAWALRDDGVEPRLFLASVLDATGHRGDAKAILEQWVALHPDSTEAKRLESHLAQMGPRAERVMRKTIER
jgi:hypothetical protein